MSVSRDDSRALENEDQRRIVEFLEQNSDKEFTAREISKRLGLPLLEAERCLNDLFFKDRVAKRIPGGKRNRYYTIP